MFARAVARHAGALGERERLVEEAERGLDAVQLVAADAERVQRRRRARRSEKLPASTSPRASFSSSSAGAARPDPHLRAPGADQRANLRAPGTPVARAAGTSGSNSAAASSFLVRLDTAPPPARVRPRAGRARRSRRRSRGSPRRRRAVPASHSTVSRGRARLAALDLGDVLLREALARELALRQAGGDAKLAQPLAQAEPAGSGVRLTVWRGRRPASWRRRVK